MKSVSRLFSQNYVLVLVVFYYCAILFEQLINQFIKADSGMLRDLYSTLLQFWGKNDLSACGTVFIVARCYLDFVFRLDRSRCGRCGFLYRNGFLGCCRSALQSVKNIFACDILRYYNTPFRFSSSYSAR